MDRRTLVDRMARWAKSRYRISVNDVQFGYWLRSDLLKAPPKAGQARNWTRRHYRIALEICSLKSQGVKSVDAMRWHLWLKDFEPPRFVPTNERRALSKEFRRVRKLGTARVRSTYDPKPDGQPSDWQVAVISRSMGQQDERLKAIVQFDPHSLTDIWGLTRFGEGGALFASDLANFFGKVSSFLPVDNEDAKVAETIQWFSKAIPSLFTGYFGDRKEIENSAEDTVLRATRAQFEQARTFLKLQPLLLEAAKQVLVRESASDIIAGINTPDWRIGNYVTFLHMIFRDNFGVFEKMENIEKLKYAIKSMAYLAKSDNIPIDLMGLKNALENLGRKNSG
jgi:hypothetical protein